MTDIARYQDAAICFSDGSYLEVERSYRLPMLFFFGPYSACHIGSCVIESENLYFGKHL